MILPSLFEYYGGRKGETFVRTGAAGRGPREGAMGRLRRDEAGALLTAALAWLAFAVALGLFIAAGRGCG
jgi:hypothetical protein